VHLTALALKSQRSTLFGRKFRRFVLRFTLSQRMQILSTWIDNANLPSDVKEHQSCGKVLHQFSPLLPTATIPYFVSVHRRRVLYKYPIKPLLLLWLLLWTPETKEANTIKQQHQHLGVVEPPVRLTTNKCQSRSRCFAFLLRLCRTGDSLSPLRVTLSPRTGLCIFVVPALFGDSIFAWNKLKLAATSLRGSKQSRLL
jgi:hypothetical protein